MTRRERRRFINDIRRIRNLFGHSAAAGWCQDRGISPVYWDYNRGRLTGVTLTDTRGRGIAIDL